MNKELFVEAIEAIEKQVIFDIEVSKHLGNAFPDAFTANLLPKNHYLQNILIKILKTEMNDLTVGGDNQSWIEWFCWETNFGKESYRLKAYNKDKTIIPLSNASELYDFLINQSDVSNI